MNEWEYDKEAPSWTLTSRDKTVSAFILRLKKHPQYDATVEWVGKEIFRDEDFHSLEEAKAWCEAVMEDGPAK